METIGSFEGSICICRWGHNSNAYAGGSDAAKNHTSLRIHTSIHTYRHTYGHACMHGCVLHVQMQECMMGLAKS